MAKRNMKESMDNITNIKDSTAALSPEMQLAKEKAKDKDEEFEKIVLGKDGVLGASKQPTPDKPKWSLDESLFDKPISLNESGFDVDSVLDSVRDGSIDSTTIVDFLSDHETAFEDACEAFDVFADDFDEQCEALNKEDPEDLVNWISEHEMLWTDFCNYIGSELNQFNESLDKSLKESFYWLSDSRINILKRLGYSSKEDLAFAENLCEEEGLDLEEIVNTLDDIYKNGKEKAEAFYRDYFVDEDGNPIEIDESLNEAAGNKVTLFCTFEPYERYGGGGRLKKVRATGTDNLNAISKLVDKMRLYIDSECIEEDEMTFEDVINELEASNGDGCDFIYELKDNQGNVYISDEYEEEYEDVDESLSDREDIQNEIHRYNLLAPRYDKQSIIDELINDGYSYEEAEYIANHTTNLDESLRKDKNMKRYIIEEMKEDDQITDIDAYNESRDAKLVKRYKSILGLDEDFEITEENLDDWALKHACSLEGANYDRAKAAVLGLKFEGYK